MCQMEYLMMKTFDLLRKLGEGDYNYELRL